MTLSSLHSLLQHAEHRKYAVPAFNAYNLETAQAIVQAAEQARSPLFLQFSHKAVTDYATPDSLAGLALPLVKRARIPVAIHYDHGKDLKTFEACLRTGFNSGMLDGSRLPFAENVSISKRAAAIARKYHAGVEVEIGRLAGKEEWVQGKRGEYTDPREAVRFVQLIKPDALAVSFGSAHGHAEKKLHLDFSLLKELDSKIHIPLVLHGSSGVPDSQIRKAIKLGIRKVNMDTQLRVAFTKSIRRFLQKDSKVTDPRDFLSVARESMQKTAIQRMKVLGSTGKA